MLRARFIIFLLVLTACSSVNRDIAPLDPFNVPKGLTVKKVSASSDDGNVPKNTLDNDLDTRWSAEGDGEWIMFELAERTEVEAVAIAWYKGDARVADFRVEVSSDGTTWIPVFEGSSSGTSRDLQTYSFSPTRANQVRIVGYGNTQNDWNSLTEVRLLESGGDPEPVSPVYRETFEGVPLGTYKGKSDLRVQTCGGQGRCLRAQYRPNRQGSPRLVFREKLPAAREYTLTYKLRFHRNFEWVKGGKLPGLGPENPVTGCQPLRDDGWSVRLMWRQAGSFVQYLYHQEKDDRCGEDVRAEDFSFQKDRWYDVALYVRVNRSTSERDGQVRLFVDGEEVARRDNLRLRKTSSGGLIERFMFSSFYGGNSPEWAPSRTTYAYFDDFAVYPGLRNR